MDKFPEAFQRFEQVVDVSKIRSFKELLAAFKLWAGRKWVDSPLQIEALKFEAFKREIPLIPVSREEYEEEKRVIDQLYRRVYYTKRRLDYNKARFEYWKATVESARARALTEGWTSEMLATVVKPLLPRLRRAEERVRFWEKEWQEAYNRLKHEHRRFRLKIVERKIRD